jgi:NifB/MoaA-like Fe-S oxidoreductase
VASIAIVPAGITRHRRNKIPIPAIDAQYSARILYKARHWQRRFLREKSTRLVWAADEFYLSAGQRVPSRAAYEGFPQLANGVGLVRLFRDSARYSVGLLRGAGVSGFPFRPAPLKSRNTGCSLVTGTLAAPLLREWAESVEGLGLKVTVYPIVNRLFGDTVTVAGLISGRDVIDQLRGADLGGALIIPSVALRDGAFLDDVTVGEVESALRVRVVVADPLPHRLVRVLVG